MGQKKKKTDRAKLKIKIHSFALKSRFSVTAMPNLLFFFLVWHGCSRGDSCWRNIPHATIWKLRTKEKLPGSPRVLIHLFMHRLRAIIAGIKYTNATHFSGASAAFSRANDVVVSVRAASCPKLDAIFRLARVENRRQRHTNRMRE